MTRCLVVLSLLGCVPYRPTVVAPPPAPQPGGYPVARQVVPNGEVVTASLGITGRRVDETTEPARLLHVRMTVWNRSELEHWSVDTRNQRVNVAGRTPEAPSYVEAGPTVAVEHGERKAIDLYFALPASVRNESDLPGFELAWEVTTGDRLVSRRTSFVRLWVDPGASLVYVVPPWAMLPWW